MTTLIANAAAAAAPIAPLAGYVHCEFWGKTTSRKIFEEATTLAAMVGCKVTARDGYDAPSDEEGGPESAFTFSIEATPAQFREFCDGMRNTYRRRVKEAALGRDEGDDD